MNNKEKICLIDRQRKVVYIFNTNDQATVEFFCINVIGYHYHNNGAIFCYEKDVDKIMKRITHKKHPVYMITQVKQIGKKYNFEITYE